MGTMNEPAARSPKPEARSDRGVALVVALLMMMLLSALGLSLTMVTSTEERVADAYLSGSETFYAADAAFELAVQELALVPDWSRVLDGSVTSTFVDDAGSNRGAGQADWQRQVARPRHWSPATGPRARPRTWTPARATGHGDRTTRGGGSSRTDRSRT